MKVSCLESHMTQTWVGLDAVEHDVREAALRAQLDELGARHVDDDAAAADERQRARLLRLLQQVLDPLRHTRARDLSHPG